MRLVKTIAAGAAVGGLAGGLAGIEAAYVFRAANAHDIAASTGFGAIASNTVNDFEDTGSTIIQVIFTAGSAALGALVAASESLNFRYSSEEIDKNRQYTE